MMAHLSPYRKRMSSTPPTNDTRLIWIDLEMTGLDPDQFALFVRSSGQKGATAPTHVNISPLFGAVLSLKGERA